MRLIVGLTEDASPEDVAAALRGEGAVHVQASDPAQPLVLVVEFADTAPTTPAASAEPDGGEGELLARVAALAGVRYAEPDQMRGIY